MKKQTFNLNNRITALNKAIKKRFQLDTYKIIKEDRGSGR